MRKLILVYIILCVSCATEHKEIMLSNIYGEYIVRGDVKSIIEYEIDSISHNKLVTKETYLNKNGFITAEYNKHKGDSIYSSKTIIKYDEHNNIIEKYHFYSRNDHFYKSIYSYIGETTRTVKEQKLTLLPIVKRIDKKGFLITEGVQYDTLLNSKTTTFFDKDKNRIKSIDESKNYIDTAEYTYNSMGLLIAENRTSNKKERNEKYTYKTQYDSFNNLIKLSKYTNGDFDGHRGCTIEYYPEDKGYSNNEDNDKYDYKGPVKRYVDYRLNLSTGRTDTTREKHYDMNGLVVCEYEGGYSKIAKKYDKEGRLVEENKFSFNSNSYSSTVYSYDNPKTSTSFYINDWSLNNHDILYNNRGFLNIKNIEPDTTITEKVIYSSTHPNLPIVIESENKVDSFAYNEFGEAEYSKTIYLKGNKKSERSFKETFDEYGNWTKREHYHNNHLSAVYYRDFEYY